MIKRIKNWLESRKPFPFGFYIHTQSDGWGYGYIKDGCRMFFFKHKYMGWTNHSESHPSSRCTDPAYCMWHGNL